MKKIILFALIAVLYSCSSILFAQNPKIKRILFIGNSYTSVNDLPNWTRLVGESMGDTFEVMSIAPGGRTFAMHSTDPAVLQEFKSAQYDAVILQEQSQMPAFPLSQVETDCFPYAKALCDSARAYNPFIRILFYSTWGRQNGDASNCSNYAPLCTFKGMNQLLHDRYLMMSNENQTLVAPVSSAWRDLRDSTSINLYQPDGSHPTEAGTHVAASSIYRVLFGKDLKNNGYKGSLSQLDHQRIISTVNRLCTDSAYVWNSDSCNVPSQFSLISADPVGKDTLLAKFKITRFDPRADYEWDIYPQIGNNSKKIVTTQLTSLNIPTECVLFLNTKNACGTGYNSIVFTQLGTQKLSVQESFMKWHSVTKQGISIKINQQTAHNSAVLWSTLGQRISLNTFTLEIISGAGELRFTPLGLNPGAYVLQLENGLKLGLWVTE